MRKLAMALSILLGIVPFGVRAGDAILEISGKTDMTASQSVNLSLQEFDAIDQSTVVTKTPWHKEVTTFSGVSGRALLEYLGSNAKSVEAVALNDYKVIIPVSDLLEQGLIFATRKDGAPMSIREKGPIFVVYPFDADTKLNNEVIYGRSIWQVKALNFQ